MKILESASAIVGAVRGKRAGGALVLKRLGARGICNLPCATKLRLQMGRELGRQLLGLLVAQSSFGPPLNSLLVVAALLKSLE